MIWPLARSNPICSRCADWRGNGYGRIKCIGRKWLGLDERCLWMPDVRREALDGWKGEDNLEQWWYRTLRTLETTRRSFYGVSFGQVQTMFFIAFPWLEFGLPTCRFHWTMYEMKDAMQGGVAWFGILGLASSSLDDRACHTCLPGSCWTVPFYFILLLYVRRLASNVSYKECRWKFILITNKERI